MLVSADRTVMLVSADRTVRCLPITRSLCLLPQTVLRPFRLTPHDNTHHFLFYAISLPVSIRPDPPRLPTLAHAYSIISFRNTIFIIRPLSQEHKQGVKQDLGVRQILFLCRSFVCLINGLHFVDIRLMCVCVCVVCVVCVWCVCVVCCVCVCGVCVCVVCCVCV